MAQFPLSSASSPRVSGSVATDISPMMTRRSATAPDPPATACVEMQPPLDSASVTSPGPRGIALPAEVIGREPEIEAIGRFIDAAMHGFAWLSIQGEPGLGKTTLWFLGVEEAVSAGFLVMTARPSLAEATLSFAVLGDLLEGVPEKHFAALPEPQRRALDVALLRVRGGTSPPDARTVAVATRSLLHALASERPLLLAIDDAQWVDAPSARTLSFAIRRIGEDRAGVLLTRRPEPAEGGLDVPADAAGRRVVLRGLSVGAIDLLVRERVGAGITRPTLLRIHETAQGNPFYAQELARSIVARNEPLQPGRPLPVGEDLRQLVGGRVTALPSPTREALLVVSLLAQPTIDTLDSALGERSSWLEVAVDAGILMIDEDRIRFTHPLPAAAVAAAASASALREGHRLAAALTRGPGERGRPLLEASAHPDAELADTLDDAARNAWERGAPVAAADLTEQARSVTPSRETETRWRRG